jgi:hypothetical protein
MLKFWNLFFFQITQSCEGKYWIFKNIWFFKMEILKFVNYLTNMCKNYQGARVFWRNCILPVYSLINEVHSTK